MTDEDRYHRATHAMQAGVKIEEARRPETSVSTRVGINVSLRDHYSLVRLLRTKGVITDAEYHKAIADGMEEEVRLYEERIGGGGTKITLVGKFGSIHDEEIAS